MANIIDSVNRGADQAVCFPLTAVVSMEEAKLTLILNAVNPL